MFKRKVIIAGILGVSLLCTGGIIQAATTYKSYSTTIGKLRGPGYTAYQTKATAKKAGDIKVQNLGAHKYKADMRMQASTGTGAWLTGVHSTNQYKLNNKVPKKGKCRVQFRNKLTTPVNVQVSGTWRSN